MTEQLMTWTNYGDVNPIEHGGMFVSKDKDSSSERQFYVIQVIPNGYEGEEKWLVYDGLIDLEDSWIEWDAIKETMDTPEGSDDEYLATDVMHYYGVHTGCSVINFYNRKELVEYLQNNGVEVEE
jgi:hypothetical protein